MQATALTWPSLYSFSLLRPLVVRAGRHQRRIVRGWDGFGTSRTPPVAGSMGFHFADAALDRPGRCCHLATKGIAELKVKSLTGFVDPSCYPGPQMHIYLSHLQCQTELPFASCRLLEYFTCALVRALLASPMCRCSDPTSHRSGREGLSAASE